jgi:putative transposase
MASRYPVEVRRQVVELARVGTRVAQLAETFGMSEAVIYGWLKQDRIDKDSGGTYGTLRVTAELRYDRGIHVGKGQVHLLMRRLGIYGLPKRRLPRGARVGKPSSLDLVRRRFRADGPDRLWMTDITEHSTREGKIYCCAVIDAFSRMVVGWSIDSRQTGLLVTNALGMALNRRAPREGGIIHSDQGCNSDPGCSARRSQKRASRRPWVLSAPRSIMPWSRRSGPACRSSCSTAEDGRHA